MTLQIGTILIAKEDAFMDTKEKCLTKGKEYIIKSLKGNAIVFESDFDENHEWLISEIDTDFTIKRYTLTDLKEKKIAVKLRNYAEYKILCEAVGDKNSGVDTYGATDDYFGNDNFNGNSIVFLTRKELEGRTLVPSIDLIDLEVKEELNTPVKVRTVEFLENLVRDYESEINRLKWELDKWKDEAALWNTRYHHVLSNLTDKTNELNKLRESPQISQNLEKRERMAWELLLRSVQVENSKHYSLSAEYCLNEVDTFLAKSKEVGK